MSQRNNLAYIPALTGIRAIAAFLVFFHHYQIVSLRILTEFHIGVSVFFTLSGFLIYSRYFAGSQMTRGWWRQYITNRVARIYPMYALLTCATFGFIYYANQTIDWNLFWMNITFVRGFFDEYKLTGIAPGWSLTVEECFYFSAPLLFAIARRSSLWSGLAVVYAVGGVLLVVGNTLQWHGLFTPFRFVALYTFFGRAFEFFAGMAAARFALAARATKTANTPASGASTSNTTTSNAQKPAQRAAHKTSASSPSAASPASSTSFKTGGVVSWVGFVGIFLVAWLMAQFQGGEYPYGQYHPVGIVLNNIVLPIGCGALFWGLVREKTLLAAFLGSRLMVLLGKSSYVFYLVHMSFVAALVSERLYPSVLGLQAMILVLFVAMNLLSIALFLMVEEPLNRFIRRFAAPMRRTEQGM